MILEWEEMISNLLIWLSIEFVIPKKKCKEYLSFFKVNIACFPHNIWYDQHKNVVCVFMRWGLLGFKLHICHQDRFLLLYYSTSVTLRATCNNKGDNSLLTKPWIKVPKRSRTEYNRGKPASIIEAGAFNAAFICNLHPWEQRRQDYKRYNT